MNHLRDSYDYTCMGLVGCRSDKTAYPCCEYDFVSMTPMPKRNLTVKVNSDTYLEVFSLPEELDNLRGEQLYPFLTMKFAGGNELLFSTLQGIIDSAGPNSIRADFSLSRLIDASSMAHKAQESMEKGEFLDCSFWILSATNAVATSIISRGRSQFHPSHVLDSLRGQMKIDGDIWNANALYQALGLSEANNSSLRRRTRGLDELILATLELQEGPPEVVSTRLKLLKAKAAWMKSSHMAAQAYCYLGFEVVSILGMIYTKYCQHEGIPPHQTRVLSEVERAERPYRITSSVLNKVGLIHQETVVEERLDGIFKSLDLIKSSTFNSLGDSINP